MFFLVMLVNFLPFAAWLILLTRFALQYAPDHIRMSWWAQWVERVTEPVLYPIRNWIRKQGYDTGPLDLSPMVVMFAVFILQVILRYLLAMGGIR